VIAEQSFLHYHMEHFFLIIEQVLTLHYASLHSKIMFTDRVGAILILIFDTRKRGKKAMKKVFVVMCIVAVSLLLSSQVALAGKTFFANVKADAICTVIDTDVMVDAGLVQTDAPSSGPIVSTAMFSLEQHFPNTNFWVPVGGSEVTVDVSTAFDLLPAGERYDVATQDYLGACSLISPDANAVRAVVQITVDNANPRRPSGQVFTGRCISFPNPCR